MSTRAGAMGHILERHRLRAPVQTRIRARRLGDARDRRREVGRWAEGHAVARPPHARAGRDVRSGHSSIGIMYTLCPILTDEP